MNNNSLSRLNIFFECGASVLEKLLKVVFSKSTIWIIRVTLEIFRVKGTFAKKVLTDFITSFFRTKLYNRYLTGS